MIPGLLTTGFFLTIAVALHFSTWAEGWLAANPQSGQGRFPVEVASTGDDLSGPGKKHDAVQAA